MPRRGGALLQAILCLCTLASIASAQLLDGTPISDADPGVAALIKRINRGRGGFGHNQPPPPPYVFTGTDSSSDPPAVEVESYNNVADAIAGLADSYHLSTYYQAMNLDRTTYAYLQNGSIEATYFLANDVALSYGLGLLNYSLLDAMLNPTLLRDILAYNTVEQVNDYGQIKSGQKMRTNYKLTGKNGKQVLTYLQINVGKLNSVTVKCVNAQNYQCPIQESARIISGGVIAGNSMVYIISGLIPPPAYVAPPKPKKKLRNLVGGILNGVDSTLNGVFDTVATGNGVGSILGNSKAKKKQPPPLAPPPLAPPPPPSPWDYPDVMTAIQAQDSLSSYYNALVASGLAVQINEMPFNFTVFAPCNAGMDSLITQMELSMDQYLQMPAVMIATLQSTVVLQDNLDKELLTDGLWLQALNGKPLLVTRAPGFDPQISTTENFANILTYDISVGDDDGPYGTVHITDNVLLTKPFFDNT